MGNSFSRFRRRHACVLSGHDKEASNANERRKKHPRKMSRNCLQLIGDHCSRIHIAGREQRIMRRVAVVSSSDNLFQSRAVPVYCRT